MATSRLTTLGGFAFSVNGNPTHSPSTRKSRALMAYLIMNRTADAARERLIEIFWPDAEPQHARDSLKTALWSIRRCLRTAGVQTDEYVLATKSIIRWTADTRVDASEFADLAAREDLVASREALQLYHGDFLEGDYDDWVVAERERLASLYESVLARVVKTSKDTDAAQRFIARNPYHEHAYATLIEAELAAGRRASAAAWVERCRKALSEVGEKTSAAFETQFGNIPHIDLPAPDELTLPFTGRESELAFLTARFTEVKSGRGSVTLVHGEAGIGKTSLLKRAAQAATQNGLRALTIRCASEVPSTFGPWPGVFRALGAGDFDAFVRSCTTDLAEALARAIAACLPGPTAIFVDDAHELTAEALDTLVALALTAASKHAVILGLRPEGVSMLRSRLVDLPFEELPVLRLGRGSLKWALAQALGNEQPELLDVLYQRTGGHPLFFAGLLNSLVSAGALARRQDRWQLTKSIETDIELPDTIRHFIEARLQARGNAPRTVACALALEPAVSADDLIAVLRMDESAVLDALDDLLALALIVQPTSGPQFAFAHELIREVAAAGLNVGRRTTLHRAFAQRLSESGELEVSLRLARHLEAAGDSLAAAQSYLKSALGALELNAPQDGIDRCDAGIQSAEKLERTPARDALLARLQSTAARAAIAAGNAAEALKRARDAVTFAQTAADVHESAQAMLTLAAMEGAAFRIQAQKSDAEEAARSAKLCGDAALEAQALVLQASAARELGLREEALLAGHSGHELALESGDPALAAAALEELLRTQVTWWLVDDALKTARAGLNAARRAGPLAEAALLQARCTLYYLLERFDEARSDLEAALRITSEQIPRRESSLTPILPLPLLQFAGHYMAGKVAVAQRRWDEALEAAGKAMALTTIAKLPRRSEALALLRIDALFERNLGGDNAAAHELTVTLGDSDRAQGMTGWSCCVELARARDAVRMRTPDAGALLRQALNAVEENAHRAPLDADRAFGRLAEAAEEAGEPAVADRAHGRSKYYRNRRLAAAGAEWGGETQA